MGEIDRRSSPNDARPATMKLDRIARRVVRWLRSSASGRLGRCLLVCLWRLLKRNCTVFYTVQSEDDAELLRSSGLPWPTNIDRLRAGLGPGVYAWKHPTEAVAYRNRMLTDSGLIIVKFYVLNWFLARFRQLDLTRLEDDDATTWLTQFAPMYNAQADPHRLEYVRRGTNLRQEPGAIAVEHYFHSSVFRWLWFC
jgi:hypothetical protein